MADPKEPVKPSYLGPAFNATGRDDTSTEILTQTVDPATKLRRAGLISILVVAVGCMLLYSYLRNPINPLEQPEHGKPGFAVPDRKIE